MSAKLLVPGQKLEVIAGSPSIAAKHSTITVVSSEVVSSSAGHRLRVVVRNAWGVERTLWAPVEGDPDYARLGDAPAMPSSKVSVRRLACP